MANIPGTIFQMKDGSSASAGNLFPVTVVGAVLGLDATIQAIKNYYTTQLGNYWLKTDVTYDQNTKILQVGPGNTVNLATVTDLSNYYTKTEADGRFLGITANAASATKLQTARTIWGQSFDGTANVTGAMSGVTSIDSVINIDNGYVGIGKTPSVALDVNGQVQGTQLISTVTSSAPLVVASQELVTNLNADLLDGNHLADILAMDITGNAKTATNPKSELKTGQEFVFRKTNVEWDAKSGVVKKIKGKTLAWNQLVKNGNFSQGTTYWYYSNGTIAASNNILTYTVVTGANSDVLAEDSFPDIATHKYLFAAELNYSAKPTYGGDGFLGIGGYYGVAWSIQDIVPNSWFKVADIVTSAGQAATKDLRIYLRTTGMSAGDTVKLRNVVAFDLTLIFGAGNEPSTVAEFEALYPDAYYPYTPGTLISNDAEAVETTGVNQWDEEWENGYFYESGGEYHTGGDGSSTTCVRSKNFIPVLGNTIYSASVQKSGASIYRVAYFDAKMNYITISGGNTDNPFVFVTPESARYIKFFAEYYSPYYLNDICINLSNPAINGQYFPYKKSRINFGLKNIKVVSPNVWDEEWESGTLDSSTGAKIDSAAHFRSKNYVPIIGGTAYCFHGTGYSGGCDVCYYDAEKNYIPGSYTYTNWDGMLTSPSNACYLLFRMWSGTTYNHDICINKSDPALNGRYFPYGTLNLEGGLYSGSNYDGAYKACDYILDNKLHRKFGVKNGNSLTLHNTSTAGFKTYRVVLADGTVVGATAQNQVNSFGIIYNGPLNSETINYETIQYNGESDKTYYISFNPERNVEDFKLYYELQYEEVYDLAEPLPSVYPCDQYGTERVISPVSVTPSAPFCADIQYGAKSDDVANDLIGTRDAVQPLLDALQYDGQNHAWHLKGSIYADGFITAYGINGGARTSVIAPYVIESSNYSTSKIWVGLNVMNEAIAKYKQGYLVQAKKAGEYITYSVTSIDESSYILYCNGGSVTVELES